MFLEYLLTRIPYLGRLYRGEISLGRSFWLHFGLVGFFVLPAFGAFLILPATGAVGLLAVPFAIAANEVTPFLIVKAGLHICYIVAVYGYLYIATVGTWRSADAAEAAFMRERKKRFTGTPLARAGIVAVLGYKVWQIYASGGLEGMIYRIFLSPSDI